MHSALSALEAMGTRHSVPLTLQALSAQCVHRVWSHVPVSPADLPGPLSLSLCPSPGPCLASIFPSPSYPATVYAETLGRELESVDVIG